MTRRAEITFEVPLHDVKIHDLLQAPEMGKRLARGRTIQVAAKRGSYALGYMIPHAIRMLFQDASCGV